MTSPRTYHEIARGEEKAGNAPAALLHYLSSFSAAYNLGGGHPAGTVAKIRALQNQLGIPDRVLCEMVRSYGALTDEECQQILYFALYGYVEGVNAVLGNVGGGL